MGPNSGKTLEKKVRVQSALLTTTPFIPGVNVLRKQGAVLGGTLSTGRPGSQTAHTRSMGWAEGGTGQGSTAAQRPRLYSPSLFPPPRVSHFSDNLTDPCGQSHLLGILGWVFWFWLRQNLHLNGLGPRAVPIIAPSHRTFAWLALPLALATNTSMLPAAAA